MALAARGHRTKSQRKREREGADIRLRRGCGGSCLRRGSDDSLDSSVSGSVCGAWPKIQTQPSASDSLRIQRQVSAAVCLWNQTHVSAAVCVGTEPSVGVGVTIHTQVSAASHTRCPQTIIHTSVVSSVPTSVRSTLYPLSVRRTIFIEPVLASVISYAVRSGRYHGTRQVVELEGPDPGVRLVRLRPLLHVGAVLKRTIAICDLSAQCPISVLHIVYQHAISVPPAAQQSAISVPLAQYLKRALVEEVRGEEADLGVHAVLGVEYMDCVPAVHEPLKQ
eukprot:3734120-Rhodomonas_salina.1